MRFDGGEQPIAACNAHSYPARVLCWPCHPGLPRHRDSAGRSPDVCTWRCRSPWRVVATTTSLAMPLSLSVSACT